MIEKLKKKVQENKGNIDEMEERKRAERFQKGAICVALFFCLIVISLFIGFTVGQKIQLPGVESEIEAIKQEANAQIEATKQEANAQVEAAKQEANAQVEAAKKEANSKIEAFEQIIMEEYDAQKYELLEEVFENLRKLEKGETSLQFSYRLLQLDSVEIPILDYFDDSLGEQEILEYLQTLKEIVEKYPLSLDINTSVLRRLKTCEEELKDKIDSAETFQIIWDLKQQCEENRKLWEVGV